MITFLVHLIFPLLAIDHLAYYQFHAQADRDTSFIQVRYAATSIESSKSARARGAYLRVSFKNTRETAQAINGWKLQRALTYLGNVIEKKEAIPMRRYAGSTGRTSQGMCGFPLCGE